MGSVFLLVSYSVCTRKGSSNPTAEVVFGRSQDLSGCEKVDSILQSIRVCLQKEIGHGESSFCDRQ